ERLIWTTSNMYIQYWPSIIATIQELVSTIKGWLDNQAADEQVQEDGTIKKVMGTEAKDLLSQLRKGDNDALSREKQNVKVDEKFQLKNFDLITWFLVTE